MIYDKPEALEFVSGDATGLAIPAHPEALIAAGPAFLTAAFHAYGTLAPANRVTGIVRAEPLAVGSTGKKLLLTLEYAQPGPPAELFAKFSRDFEDGWRDRRRGELESEIALLELSRDPAWPIAVPAPWFGDVHHASGTGLLITEVIPFGRDGVEPLHRKCMDRELADPPQYYRAILTALARLAAAHKSAVLPRVNRVFPFDSATAIAEDPIRWSEAEVRAHVARYAEFVARCPRLLPAHLATPGAVAGFERDVLLIVRHEAAIKRFINAVPDMIALTHFNPNIDNAWFWRDPDGTLACGLFDWQRARQMNLAYALWGGLCGGDLTLWDNHLDDLLATFAGALYEGGGPRLAPETLRLHIQLYAATMGLAGMVEFPRLVLTYLPEALGASGPDDPLFERSEQARNFLHVGTIWLHVLQKWDLAASLETVLSSSPPRR